MTTQEIYTQLYKNHVTPDKIKPVNAFNNGIMHANGCLYCTDSGFTMSRIPADYPPELEGVVINRAGAKTAGLRCSYESVLPKIINTEIVKDVDLKTLNSALKKIWRVSHKEGKTVLHAVLKIGAAYYNAQILKRTLDLMAAMGSDIEIRQYARTGGLHYFLLFVDKTHDYDDFCPLSMIANMLVAEGSTRPCFTVEEALAYVPEKVKPETKNWYEK